MDDAIEDKTPTGLLLFCRATFVVGHLGDSKADGDRLVAPYLHSGGARARVRAKPTSAACARGLRAVLALCFLIIKS